ncbi:hypothetical protein HMPREF9136_2011 [Prevotella dentalis DSM 3688]|uniref:Uncharacterized protein n=1 Tax=Prevotella dentalis (strain ATCC 49559 / DSM 3688 / JCM 13448 / NCTC 12043 / ES 2772) TaxID=908937 RepID=F9D583_PREDD|nr:hypothetical protein HMPREF9136_2011 [Prevotella dentalis DSM 3688]
MKTSENKQQRLIIQKYLIFNDLIAFLFLCFLLFWGAKIGLITYPRYIESQGVAAMQLLFYFYR